MIDRAEILDLAGQLSLRPDTVEKDYVLGWILAGIGRHPETGSSWVFKGGTCLKKVYFETYRFSEDLDFTLKQEGHLEAGFLRSILVEVSAWVYEESGILIPAEEVRVDVHRNPRGRPSAEARIYYRGPLAPGGSLPAIRFDLTADEVLVLDPVRQRVWHPYSDEPAEGISVLCYPFTEVFAEKVRALAERGRPRDLYDVVNLFRRPEAREGAGKLLDILDRKCRHKGISIPDFHAVEAHRDELATDWDAMLGRQLPQLPSLDGFWSELPAFFLWLRSHVSPPSPPPRPVAAGEQVIRLGLGGLGSLGGPTTALESIRFAAANHLCVDLDYVDEQGQRRTRTIEPYSLRRTQEGNVVLHAERADGGGHRSYRIDRIRGAHVTNRAFVPRLAIELAPSGYLSIPPSTPRVSAPLRARRLMTPVSAWLRRPRSGRRRMAAGPTYVYQCIGCGKQLPRKTQDSRLKPHKTKSGAPCPSRTGWLVRMGY